MVRPTPGMGWTKDGVHQMLLDDAQVLAAEQNRSDHRVITP